MTSFKLKYLKIMVLNFYFMILIFNIDKIDSLHLKGTFNTNEFFKFLTRFGIQSTDSHDLVQTRGYIYGNISILSAVNLNISKPLPENMLIMLTLMDYDYFIGYYNNRRIMPRSIACPTMFEKIEKTAYFFDCFEEGKQDFIRRVPCEKNNRCVDESESSNLIEGYQFTYKIQDSNQARFWYLSLVACIRDKNDNCKWKHLDSDLLIDPKLQSTNNYQANSTIQYQQTNFYQDNDLDTISYTIEYDIWLVNGHPNSKNKNRFEHQFTYELRDIFEIYLYSFLIYLFILPFIIYRLKKHFHYLYLQLLIYVSIELTCRFLSLVHNFVFSINGNGVYFLQFISDFLEALASSILILILISVAKGWTIRSKVLITTTKSYLLGFFLQSVLVISHMIALATIDPVFNTNSYETVAGYVELGTRFFFMVWFLLELKETFKHLDSAALRNQYLNGDETVPARTLPNSNDSDIDSEEYEMENNMTRFNNINSKRTKHKNFYTSYTREERVQQYQKFYLHYGACCLVWFIYLPVLVFITSFVSELYRLRLVLSIRYFVNFISVVVLFYIMWSPKTPLKLPGKKPPIKYELTSSQYLLSQEANEDDSSDQAVLFSVKQTNLDQDNDN